MRRHDPDRCRRAAPSVPWRTAQALRGSNSSAAARTSGGCPSSARLAGPISSAASHRRIETASDRDIERQIARLHGDLRKIRPRRGCGARALRMQTRTDRDLPAPAAAVSGRVCRPPAAAPSSTGFRAARASRRMPAGPTAAAPCAYWQRKAPARRRTSRRTARPADRSSPARTDRPLHPRARNRPAGPPARSAARAPASAPRCRCPRT